VASGRLLAVEDSILVVVDAQPGFYGDDPAGVPEPLAGSLARAAWVAAVAAALDVPTVVTEEDPARSGPTDRRILAVLPSGATAFTKDVFGAADQEDILAAVAMTGRRTVVLVGLETDVCIAQTALGLLDRGHRVAVVEDAVYSPGFTHQAGIRRMVDSGAELVHAKGLYYEWVRTLDAARGFERDHPELADPPGFRL
jgi:nicotinamidase-related amidase